MIEGAIKKQERKRKAHERAMRKQFPGLVAVKTWRGWVASEELFRVRYEGPRSGTVRKLAEGPKGLVMKPVHEDTPPSVSAASNGFRIKDGEVDQIRILHAYQADDLAADDRKIEAAQREVRRLQGIRARRLAAFFKTARAITATAAKEITQASLAEWEAIEKRQRRAAKKAG